MMLSSPGKLGRSLVAFELALVSINGANAGRLLLSRHRLLRVAGL
jgi:hypothetical protein